MKPSRKVYDTFKNFQISKDQNFGKSVDYSVDPQDRSTWRTGVRSALGPASQLPAKGPTDVESAPINI